MQILALDLDGTLTNSQKQITPHTLEAITRAQEKGVIIVLASGRPTYGIAPIAQQLNLHEHGGYVMAFNGGQIIDWSSETTLFKQTLEPSLLPRLQKWARYFDLPLISYRGNIIITEKPKDSFVLKNALINHMPVEGVGDIATELCRLPEPPTKCLMTGDPKRIAQAEAEMREDLGAEMEIYRSAPYFLELVPKGIDKARSLQFILDRHHLTPDDLIACGDSDNDLSMIRFAGLGVAMANAEPPVLAAADYVTLSNDEDGVAAVIERFLL